MVKTVRNESNTDWTDTEVQLIVADYFNMLQLELRGMPYNKTEHRKALLLLLNNRSNESIEFKHQNISAVLVNMGQPYINGYKPRFRYQHALEAEVAKYIVSNKPALEKRFEAFAEDPVIDVSISNINFSNFLDNAPVTSIVSEEEPTYLPIKINYLEREQNNRSLGEKGESLIIEYERWSLIKAGKESLADKIEWVSKDLGDGTGFDILSKNFNGTDKFIEVKTTKLAKPTPIFLTKNEFSFSQKKDKDFYLYRIFNFRSHPQFFMKQGRYETYCRLEPQNFKGYFSGT